MSPAMSALASVGITHEMLVLSVLALVVAGVIGMYWQIIVPGAIVVVVGSLFINFTPVKPVEDAKETIKKEDVFDEHAAYIKDCTEVAQYKLYECENLWKGRQADDGVEEKHAEAEPVSKVTLIDVENEEYKARRAEALKNPNAVVIHETYH
jgi:hypothetical protein